MKRCLLPASVMALFMLFSVVSCRNTNTEAELASVATEEFVTPVEVMEVEIKNFTRELLSNGKLRAMKKTNITFRIGEELLRIYVRNGQEVARGEVLAELCRNNLDRRIRQVRIATQRSAYAMEDLLLGRGYTMADSLQVPEHLWEVAGINSGWFEAINELNNLEKDLENTRLTAPFNGVVAGIEAQVHDQVIAGGVFCTLIDHSEFLVEFPIMEHELPMVSLGSAVEINPFGMADTRYKGKIYSINPVVADNGQVLVSALITGTTGLMEGMNVRAIVKQTISNQMVVPKSAVLYRDNLEVLFRMEEDKAVWTYVHILHQNSTHYSVVANPDRVASLQPGDMVITAGNMNLAHGSLVTTQ